MKNERKSPLTILELKLNKIFFENIEISNLELRNTTIMFV